MAMRRAPSRALLYGILILITALALLTALSVGAANLPFTTVLDVIMGSGTSEQRAIVLELRLPRALMALLAGGALALSGTVFQAVLRNPLAEPYVLGVSGGAAVGAVAAIMFGIGQSRWALPIAALAGALLTIVLVLRIAFQAGRALDSRVLLLAGVIAGAFLNAIILLMLTFADVESFRSAIFWMMGSLAGASWGDAALLGVYVLPGALLLLTLARPLNLLALGEETAANLGTRVTRVKVIAYLAASLLTAVSVATCGVIGFIGLIIPHTLRLVRGGEHGFLLPASFIAGAAFLLFTDTLARTIAPPTELPVGVVTALIGVPVFVALLRRGTS